MLDVAFSLLTLTVLEIILGIDNLVFIAILSARLPSHQQARARRFGLMLALITRLILLASALQLVRLNTPLFTIFGFAFSGRDIFFLLGGLFLIVKATQEIHAELDVMGNHDSAPARQYSKFLVVIIQIALFDIIFSLDSILAAIGLTQKFWIMAIAIAIAILIMILASDSLSRFIHRYPTIKMLALSFLLLIGTTLIADGFHFDIPRGYIYFSVCFSLLVEGLNILLMKKKTEEVTKNK